MWIQLLLEPLVLPLVFALWIFWDARSRGHDRAKWTMGAFFLSPIVVPNYFAKRNLRSGESRTGGTNWHWLKNFALYWTLFACYFLLFDSSSAYNIWGSHINEPLGLYTIAWVWAIPTLLALLVGLFFRDASKVEEGPTGVKSISPILHT
ncbi:MAG: hypothetical protein U5J63_00260 [Fodinibius sp.]|nr:hypothetical protein [Fodinibius sp.]